MGQSEREEMLEKNLASVVGPLKRLVDQTATREPEPAAVVQTPRVVIKRKLADTAQHPGPQKRVKISDSTRIPPAVSRFQRSDDDEMDEEVYNRILIQAGPSRVDESATPHRPKGAPPRGLFIDGGTEQSQSEEENFESPAKSPVPEMDMLATPEAQMAALNVIDTYMGPLTRDAFKSYLFSKDKMDLIYGVRFDGRDWKMGNKLIKVNDDDEMAIIDPQDDENFMEFKTTPGLINLIMYKTPIPELWTRKDLETYKEILDFTNVHRRLWRRQEQLKGSSGGKWTTVIKPLIEGKRGLATDDSIAEESAAAQNKRKKNPKVTVKRKKKSGGSIPSAMVATRNEIDYDFLYVCVPNRLRMEKFGRHLNLKRRHDDAFPSKTESNAPGKDDQGNFIFQDKRLTNVGDPVSVHDAATKSYVDQRMNKTSCSFNSRRLENVGEPVEANDAATKANVV